MRPIKFRAWDDKNKQWLLGYDMENLGGFSLFGETIILGEWTNILNTFLFGKFGYTFDDLKVMQFTGLLDKNGKEIYESDRVRRFSGQEYIVTWLGAGFWLVNPESDDIEPTVNEMEQFTVIGNIYEN